MATSKLADRPKNRCAFVRRRARVAATGHATLSFHMIAVLIGSRSNVSDNAAEADRARIFEFNPDGTDQKVYAWEFATPSEFLSPILTSFG